MCVSTELHSTLLLGTVTGYKEHGNKFSPILFEKFIGSMECVYEMNCTVLCYRYSDRVQRIGKKYRKMRSIHIKYK
jgi:hypothetical protein